MVTTADQTGPEENPTLQVTVELTGVRHAWTRLTVRVKVMIGIVVIVKVAVLALIVN